MIDRENANSRPSEASSEPAESYDQVPYPSVPFAQSHPSRMAAIAALYGLAPGPAHPDSARVLEIGCAQGDNAIPLALQHPTAEIVGIDVSPRQIATAREKADRLGAKVRFETIDVAEFPEDLGSFDFILCHGVYSWVPAHVRGAILDVIQQRLRPHGIAYLSYNVNPGWRLKSAIREILLLDTNEIESPEARIDRAQRLLATLADGVPAQLPFRQIVRNEIDAHLDEEIRRTHVFHEYLETVNEAFYFHEFIEQIGSRNLRFLSEADLEDMHLGHLPRPALEFLGQLRDPIERERYRDFFTCRAFRQSLICHQAAESKNSPSQVGIEELRVSANLKHAEDLELGARQPVVFRDVAGREAAVDHPMTKAALVHLGETWPQSASVRNLDALSRAATSNSPVTVQRSEEFHRDSAELRSDLLHLALAGMVEVHLTETPLVLEPGDRPQASPWARHQAATGGVITNLRHRAVELTDLDRLLLPLLDGSRTLAELATVLAERCGAEDLVIAKNGVPARDPQTLSRTIAESLPAQLRGFGRLALLVA